MEREVSIVKMTGELNIPFDRTNCWYCVYHRFGTKKECAPIDRRKVCITRIWGKDRHLTSIKVDTFRLIYQF